MDKKKVGWCLVIFVSFVLMLQSSVKSLPNYRKLYEVLIDLPGWKKEKPTGSSVEVPEGKAITVNTTYKKGDKEFTVNIIGGTMASNTWKSYDKMTKFENSKVYAEAVTIKEYNAIVHHEKKDSEETIVILLKGRSENSNGIIVGKYKDMGYNEAVEIIKEFPLDELNKLLKS